MSKYSEKFKDPRWQKKRLQIMNRDKFTCKLCGDTETTLNVHHKEYISGNDPWDYPNNMLVTLCEHCHEEISADKFKGVLFSDLKIYKSNKWDSEGRIIFVAYKGTCSMSIYDSLNDYIVGCNFIEDIPYILEIMKKALKDG